MASKTLVNLHAAAARFDARIFLARYPFRHHFEVHHVVAGRCLVTLSTVPGIGGRVLELRNGPSNRTVTARAIRTKQPHVAIPRRMTGLTVKRRLQGRHLRMTITAGQTRPVMAANPLPQSNPCVFCTRRTCLQSS